MSVKYSVHTGVDNVEQLLVDVSLFSCNACFPISVIKLTSHDQSHYKFAKAWQKDTKIINSRIKYQKK